MKKTITMLTLQLTLINTAMANLSQMQKEMDEFQKPMIMQLQKTLQSEPNLKVNYIQYLKEMKNLEQIKDPEEKTQLAFSINKKYQQFFDLAFKKSNIDQKQRKMKAAELSMKYSRKDAKYNLQAGEYLTYVAWLENQKQDSPPTESEVEFSAPFEFEHSSHVGEGTVNSRLETGRMYASAYSMIVASYQNRAGVGMFLRIPWQNRLVRVSARLPETSYSVTTFAGGGASGAKSFSVIDVVGEDGPICVKSIEHAVAVAPVIWFAKAQGTNTTVFACETRSPQGNQDIAIRFQSGAEIVAGGGAFAIASTGSTPAPIRVRLIQ